MSFSPFVWYLIMHFITSLHPKQNNPTMRTLVAILLPLLTFFTTLGQSGDNPTSLLKKGIALHDKGDYAGAIKIYDEILKQEPDNTEVLYEKTFSLIQQGSYQECVDLCKDIIKRFPDNEFNKGTYINYGTALDHLKKPEEAIQVYTEGINKYPKAALLYFNRAVTENIYKQTDKAIADLKTSISLNPFHTTSHLYLGLLIASSNKTAAMMSLSTFLLIEPSGQRAERALTQLLNLAGSNVEKKDAKNITISLDSKLVDSTVKMEDDFRSSEVAMSMLAALGFDKKNSKKNVAEKLSEQLSMIIGMISERKGGNQTGFYTSFYVPFLKSLKDGGYLETAGYLMCTASDEKEVKKWISKNKGKIDELYSYMRDYKWTVPTY
jgi:tetratricopeptide (TPR) repeat protein